MHDPLIKYSLKVCKTLEGLEYNMALRVLGLTTNMVLDLINEDTDLECAISAKDALLDRIERSFQKGVGKVERD